MTQNQKILAMLKRGPVTPLVALRAIGCMRLASRIYDLRQEGHDIACDIIHDGDKRYAQYRLVKS